MKCSICGAHAYEFRPVLWPALIDEWQISPDEAAYIDRQQGETCAECGSNLRSIALADALRWAFGTTLMLRDFCASKDASRFRVLELNEAGTLHPFLSQLSGHVFGAYPAVDMHALPYPSGTFDVVVHSDTLEHVPNPIHALGECRRVLKEEGTLCYTCRSSSGGNREAAKACRRAITGIHWKAATTTPCKPNSEPTPGPIRCRPAFRTYVSSASSTPPPSP